MPGVIAISSSSVVKRVRFGNVDYVSEDIAGRNSWRGSESLEDADYVKDKAGNNSWQYAGSLGSITCSSKSVEDADYVSNNIPEEIRGKVRKRVPQGKLHWLLQVTWKQIILKLLIDTCDRTRLKEAPAKKSKGKYGERVKVTKF